MTYAKRFVGAVLFLTCIWTTACNGQNRETGNDVDPSLVATVDSMLPKLELLAGLKKLEPVALATQSREALRKYVEDRLEEELPPKELEGIQQTYAALGLVPDTMDLKKLLIDVYQEQVAGYYDPTTEKFYIIEGTPVSMLRPVLAHELVHALQDQHVDLDSLIARKRGNDRQTAAQAAIEGHATVVMFALLTQEAVRRDIIPGDMPDITAQLAPALDAQNSQFPVFKNAPRIIRETMVFPYVGGAGFVQKLWHARNTFVAPLAADLPQSTEQVLHVNIERPDAPTEVRFANTKDVVYENTFGELEMGVFLTEHLGTNAAAYGWDGDRYQLLENKTLMWQTIWDDRNAADRFAAAYRRIAEKRTNRAIRVERNVVQGREGVLVMDAPAGTDLISVQAPAVRLLP